MKRLLMPLLCVGMLGSASQMQASGNPEAIFAGLKRGVLAWAGTALSASVFTSLSYDESVKMASVAAIVAGVYSGMAEKTDNKAMQKSGDTIIGIAFLAPIAKTLVLDPWVK